ncbi:MAG: DUF971 domain-containing protein [Herbaspirillum sp.]|nr:DUF971 domain-containing protein [Herbaspirillum sp.]
MPQALTLTNHAGSARLHIEWDDGQRQQLSHHQLRLACRCADCTALRQRHGRTIVAAADISLLQILPVGQYGVQLVFDDGHDRGIYPWSFLRSLPSLPV